MFLGGTWHAVGLQAAAGFAVFFGIQRFFKEVDEKLNDDTQLEIAVWLLGVKVRPKIRLSPDTIASVLDRVFGKNTLSWRCFWRTCLLSNIMTSLVVIIKALANVRELKNDPTLVLVAVLVIFFLFFLNGAMGFMLLMETRWILGLLRRWNFPVLWFLLLIVDAIFTFFFDLVYHAAAYSVDGRRDSGGLNLGCTLALRRGWAADQGRSPLRHLCGFYELPLGY